jgi:hypothetical protein
VRHLGGMCIMTDKSIDRKGIMNLSQEELNNR